MSGMLEAKAPTDFSMKGCDWERGIMAGLLLEVNQSSLGLDLSPIFADQTNKSGQNPKLE